MSKRSAPSGGKCERPVEKKISQTGSDLALAIAQAASNQLFQANSAARDFILKVDKLLLKSKSPKDHQKLRSNLNTAVAGIRTAINKFNDEVDRTIESLSMELEDDWDEGGEFFLIVACRQRLINQATEFSVTSRIW